MKSGIYPDLTEEEYHSLDMVNSTMLQRYRELPELAILKKDITSAMQTGIEGHGGFLSGFGQKDMKPANWERFLNLKQKLESGQCEIAKKLIQQGQEEITLIWEDKKTGLPCKARLDLLVEKALVIADLKFTTNVNPQGWLKTSLNSGGHPHYQAHWYLRGAQGLGIKVDTFLWVLMQTKAPWSITVCEASEEMLYAAQIGIDEILPEIARCRSTGIWPGYADEITKLDLPAWFYKREEL